MKVIGLTGGIGTGKSTVSSYLKEKNIPIIDADLIAHEITEVGSPVLSDIRKLLGDGVFFENGEMDRRAVAQIVFNDKNKLEAFECLTTNEVAKRCKTAVEDYKSSKNHPIAVVDAPLLFECGMEKLVDETWLVNANIEVRLERVKKRDGISEQEILDRINNQMSTDEKAALADFVIDNSGNLKHLYDQIDKLLEG